MVHPPSAVLCLLLLARRTSCFVGPSAGRPPRPPSGPAAAKHHPRTRRAARPSSESSTHAPADGPTDQKPKRRRHDRRVDRRKNPALWRDDFEYSPGAPGDYLGGYLPTSPPELMSPAGGWSQLLAAVSNGADAVYLGLTSYSARARAENFDPDPSLLDGLLDDEGRFDVDSYSPPKGRPAPLAAATRLAHRHRVRVYVAFNTLVFDGELREVQGLVERMWECGADAVIVQDVGVARIVKEVVDRLSARERGRTGRDGRGLDGRPLEIHASTQQTVTCADGVSYAAQRTNSTRVVLGRELSASEIASISTNSPDVEVEAFVHGALCVSYSGQCFSSEAWGGRSANRGQCAQACRLPYGLVANGVLRHLTFDGAGGILGRNSGGPAGNGEGGRGDGYLLSPQDLCGLDHVESLARAGVSCLKIEGRLKDASYVAATTRSYRRAIDEAWDAIASENPGKLRRTPRRILSSPDEGVSRRDLQHVFARGQDEDHDGLTPGFFDGPRHQRLVRGRSPRHRGLHVGRVAGSDGGSLRIRLDGRAMEAFGDDGVPPLKRGDGIVVDRGMAQEEELGGPLYDVRIDGDTAVVRFGRDVEARWRRDDGQGGPPMAPRDAHVWKTSDAEIGGRMGRLAALDPPRWPADVAVGGAVGGPLTVRITDLRSGVSGSASSEEVLEEATGTGLGEVAVRKAVGTLGNTRWSLGGLDVGSLDPGAWAPMGRVKDARRRAVEDLERRVAESEGGPGGHAVASDESSDLHETEEEEEEEEPVVDELLGDIADGGRVRPPDASGEGPRVSVLCRTYDQVDAICRMMEEDISRHDDDEWSSSRACRRVDELIVDFLEVDSLERAVERIRGSGTGAGVVLASPRVIKPGEEGIWKTLLRLRPDGLLVRSTGLLHRLTRLGGTGASVDLPAGGDAARRLVSVAIPELVGDFSLNAANALTAHEYLASGLARITASYDLSASAITELATHLGGGRGTPGSSRTSLASRLEVVVHCHMPIFHTEHCVFARFLSGGDSYQDCGHVCTRETVHLRDQEGRDNLVLADMGCRNTVFQAESQSGVYSMDEWADAGVGSFRIELVDERGDDAVGVVSSYLAFLAGERQASDVWRALDAVPDSNGRAGGVGVGSLRNASERRSGSLSSSIH